MYCGPSTVDVSGPTVLGPQNKLFPSASVTNTKGIGYFVIFLMLINVT